jgi:N-acetyl-anhydromuramyl-L-alanine amidase AmpD
MALAATLTGVSERRLRTDPNANICGGAAVLASYQRNPSGNLQEWDAAVSRYGVSASGDSATFARQVYATLRPGESRRTDNGDRVALAPHRRIAVPSAAKSDPNTDCPDTLNCEWIEAPYERTNETGGYGNHDLSDRTGLGGPKLRYIVIHGTESNYQSTINAVQDPTYVSWNYTIRSSDGHIAQHLDPKDVGYHAGNWWMNTHSIGLEHEGKSGTDAWWTESLYQNSATLVRYLTAKYDIPRDRSHIIGHDQIPGILPGRTQSMHWDPGPYWDWEHYMRLLKAPIADAKEATKKVDTGDVVTVRPGYAENTNEVTGCEERP